MAFLSYLRDLAGLLQLRKVLWVFCFDNLKSGSLTNCKCISRLEGVGQNSYPN